MKYAPIALVLLAIILAFSSMYVVSEHEQAFVTRFGKIQGKPKLNPGLYFKLPLSDEVHRFERRILEWDGRPSESITQDKKTIRIDTYARWRIEDPILFFEKLKDEDLARSRLSAILDGATRTARLGGGHTLRATRGGIGRRFHPDRGPRAKIAGIRKGTAKNQQ